MKCVERSAVPASTKDVPIIMLVQYPPFSVFVAEPLSHIERQEDRVRDRLDRLLYHNGG